MPHIRLKEFGSSELNLYTSTDEIRVPYSSYLDGTVALRLHNYTDGSAWGQNVGTDQHPVFSGKVINHTSDLKVSKLTFNAGIDHEPYPEGYVEGQVTPLPIPTRDGYAFIGWFENKEFTGDTILTINRQMTGDKELYAMWATLPKLVNGCYEIGTASELYGFAAIVNSINKTKRDSCLCGKLTANITINGSDQNGAYKPWFPMKNFCGTFDGNGKNISGLYYNSDSSNIGFFGSTSYTSYNYPDHENSLIKDLEIVNSSFKGDECVGTLIGDGNAVDIINVHTSGVVYGGVSVGGMAGCLGFGSTIAHSYNNANGNARVKAGSLIGTITYQGVHISNTYNRGKVSNTYHSDYGDNVIALIGYVSGIPSVIENSYHMPNGEPNQKKAVIGHLDIINSFYDGIYTDSEYGTHVTTREFNDGSVAKLLREYKSDSVDGSVWGQNVGIDDAPIFTEQFKFHSTITPATPQTTNGCYQIGTVEELFGFANIVNSSVYTIVPFCAQLTKDIVINKDVQVNKKGAIQWIPIRDFDGVFDGQGHTISGLYFNDTTVTNAGLFASVNNQSPLSEAVIKNINLADAYIRGGKNTGALVGKIDTLNRKVSIENCQVNAFVDNGSLRNETQHISGLVGEHVDGKLTIKQSSSINKLFGYGYSGGLVARTRTQDTLTIINSFCVSNGILVGASPSAISHGGNDE